MPWSAILSRIHGYRQSLPLDCEARSAVDWAAYFGEMIDELEFFGRIPASDNPEKDFVGDVHGRWGNLPPKSYGVHAGPVALLLRDYGVRAHAYRGLVWEKLQAEVAAGRPVIAWVTGHIGYSPPVFIDLSGGESARVARYEHTVIVFGYEGEKAFVLDGSWRYAVNVKDFLRSWSALDFMAILEEPLPGVCPSNEEELIP